MGKLAKAVGRKIVSVSDGLDFLNDPEPPEKSQPPVPAQAQARTVETIELDIAAARAALARVQPRKGMVDALARARRARDESDRHVALFQDAEAKAEAARAALARVTGMFSFFARRTALAEVARAEAAFNATRALAHRRWLELLDDRQRALDEARALGGDPVARARIENEIAALTAERAELLARAERAVARRAAHAVVLEAARKRRHGS